MLKELFEKKDCDKAKHFYHKVYEPHFEKRKNDNINILEVGIFHGKSTEAFLEYFPNATFYGIDIFERTNMEDLIIYDNPRVNMMKLDSTSEKLSEKIKEAWGEDIKFDYIIDDGAHYPEIQIPTFYNCIEFLKDDGIYWVEDCWPTQIMTEREMYREYYLVYQDNTWGEKGTLKPKFSPSEQKKMIEAFKSKCSVQAKDCRKLSKKGDSFIYELKLK